MTNKPLPSLLNLDSPKNYFQGVRSHNLCLSDNIVMFVRRKREVLLQKSFEARPHHRFVLLTIFEAAGSINVDGSVYRLNSGDTFLVTPYQFHFYMDIESDAICWHYLTFEAPEREPYESFANIPIRLDAPTLDLVADLATAYSKLDAKNVHKTNLFVLSANTLINKIKLIEESQAAIKPILGSTSGHSVVDQVNHALAEYLADGIGIAGIATQLSCSESHLRKRFKHLTGISLGSYLIHYKINQAVKLLVHSQSSLTDIAARCGYESLAAFSRSFKANLGSTPSDYRKSAVA